MMRSPENGALKVIPGSHRGDNGSPLDETVVVGQSILVNRGDVLLMRPAPGVKDVNLATI